MQTRFLYPLRVGIRRPDFAFLFAAGFHSVTGIMVWLLLPVTVASVISIVLLISLRLVWDSQAAIRDSVFLQGDGPDYWYLIRRSGGREWIRLDGVFYWGRVCFFSLGRYGGKGYVLVFASDLGVEVDHRIRVLSLYGRF